MHCAPLRATATAEIISANCRSKSSDRISAEWPGELQSGRDKTEEKVSNKKKTSSHTEICEDVQGTIRGESGREFGSFDLSRKSCDGFPALANVYLDIGAGAFPREIVLACRKRLAVDLNIFVHLDSGLFASECRGSKKK